MTEQKEGTDAPPPAAPGGGTATLPRRSPGHRATDARDAMAEMAARAQEISLEAGSKVAAALKDVINAAAGIAGFAVESARDVVQYMVRRGQMTQDEADKLIRAAEDAHVKRGGTRPAPPKSEPKLGAVPAAPAPLPSVLRPPVVAKPTLSGKSPVGATPVVPAKGAPPPKASAAAKSAGPGKTRALAKVAKPPARPAAKGSGKTTSGAKSAKKGPAKGAPKRGAKRR